MSFTSRENILGVTQSFSVLQRLVTSVPLLRRLFLPTVVLSIIAVALPQFFLWLAGVIASCNRGDECRATVPVFGWTFPVSLALLAVFVISSFVMRVVSWVLFELGAFWAMQDFHRMMVDGLRRVRTTYYDENPSGRLINRLVNDFETMKSTCLVRMGDSIQAFLEVLSVACMVLLAHPVGAVLIVPTVAAFLAIQWSVSPMLQRLSSVRSIRLGQVVHRETDLIEGAPIFVYYGAENALLQRLSTAVHAYVQAHLLRVRLESWGRLLSALVTSFYAFLAILTVALAVRGGSLSVVVGSAIITVILRLTPACSWLAWSVGLLIESVGVVRRSFEIVDLPPQEAEEFAGAPRAGTSGVPRSGVLEFRSYSMSYRADTPQILRDVTLSFPMGSRVVIVGRTGSGKTSLIQSLFRMVHVRDGDIRFGGVSLLGAPLPQVRGLFGVVPQDPYLFEGTIATNLDPDGVSTREGMLASLRAVDFTVDLDSPVREGGKNLSVGERQLICLARVILHDRPVVLLDEPTSAVDNITDAAIQRALKESLGGRTVITIAHRLDTLRFDDLIVVMNEGRVERIGRPAEVIPTLSLEDVA